MHQERQRVVGLLNQAGARLYRVLARLTLRKEVAEDLLQDLFVRLEKSAGFATATDREGFAFRAAIHLALDWRRRQARETKKLKAQPREVPEEISALEGLIRDEQVQQVLDRLEELTELEREVVVLRYLEQLDYTEVARRVGRTPQQARGLCHRAITGLRGMLKVRICQELCDG